MKIPEFKDVLLAQSRIRPYLLRTPLHAYPAVNRLVGTEIYIKHENYQPVGAFKVRGGLNLISQLTPEERKRGVVTASTGNHGQSVAFAARKFGVQARIVVPEKANPGKVTAMQGMGAEVIFHGAAFDEARLHCEALAQEKGYRYIHSGDEPLLISGVATEVLEMLEDQPDIQVIFVPVGGGSGAQSEASPAAYQSWKQKKLVEAPNRTLAEGLATGTAFALPQAILWEYLKEFVLLTDRQILQAMVWMVERAHTLAEAAGAAPLAAAYLLREGLKGIKAGLICSGGNTSLEQLRQALSIADCRQDPTTGGSRIAD
jgi:threonine dehydratase